MPSVDGAGARYFFWEQRSGEDLSDPEPMRYRIEGRGSGMFLRYPNRATTGLYRYDRIGVGFPRGAVLLPPESRAGWFPSEGPDRCIMRGSDEPGDPIERAAAETITVALGYPARMLEEPTIPNQQWPDPAGQAL